MNLLDGSFTGKELQVGALSGQKISISIGNMNSSKLKISGLKVSSFSSAGKAMTAIQKAINSVSTQRSKPVSYTHLDVYKRQVYTNAYSNDDIMNLSVKKDANGKIITPNVQTVHRLSLIHI